MRTAFSVLELLVVTAISAVLAGLMLTSIQAVREMARTTVCAGNLHQVGLLELAYASDHRGQIPPAYLRPNMTWLGSNDATIYGVHGRVMGDCWEAWYWWLGDAMGLDHTNAWNQADNFNQHLTCPSSPFKPPRDGVSTSTHWYGGNSYGPNTALLGDTGVSAPGQGGFPNSTKSTTGWPGYGIGIPGYRDNRRVLGAIGNASMTILMAEHRGANHALLGGPDNPYAYWTDAPFVRPPIGPDGRALTPPSAWGTWQTGFPWNDAMGNHLAIRVSHRGRSNYLFHDGRVAALTPWETCSADSTLPNMWTGH